MKKIVSLAFAAMLLLSVMSCSVLSAGAVETAQTAVDVQPGDTVSYTLTLSDVPEKVVGCDFSVYYDSSIFEVASVSDFNDNTDPDEYSQVINANLNGEIRSNFSILSGVKFSKRNLIGVTFNAISAGIGHISYYVRYLYPDSMIEFTEYTFTCTVLKNGEAVINDAPPELNVEESQSSGEFNNALDGKSENANINTFENPNPDVSKPDNSAEPNENDSNANNQNDGANSDNNTGNDNAAANDNADSNQNDNAANNDNADSDGNNAAAEETQAGAVNAPVAQKATKVVVSTEVAENGDIIEVTEFVEVEDAASSGSSNGGAPIAMWIIIGVIVIAAAAAIIYFVMKKKA